MADKFPDCVVIGTDLSAIQPTFVPPNVQFEIDDCEQDWLYSRPLDLIHMRALGGSIADWPKLYKRAYDNLVPGGWLQVTEFETWCSTDDNSLPKSSSLYQYMIYFSEAAAKFGKIMNIAPEHERLCKEAGFEAVVDTRIKVQCSAPAVPHCSTNHVFPDSGTTIALARRQEAETHFAVHAGLDARFARVLWHSIVYSGSWLESCRYSALSCGRKERLPQH